ncbi:hypothetical protein HK101_005865 [Irineochytrium annulatum]|nr:hypothetical protein HK101_005865 [Irineochytrium annulatum]
MRLDKFLKVSRLIKRRTVAKDVSEQGRVLVNGREAKPSANVKVGDELTVQFGQKLVTVKVERIAESTKKDEASSLYTLVKEEPIAKDNGMNWAFLFLLEDGLFVQQRWFYSDLHIHKLGHHLSMQNRKLLDLTGVSNVESFDSEEFLLQTELGHLTIRGHNLHIKNLSLEEGLLSIEGTVSSLQYLDPGSQNKNIWAGYTFLVQNAQISDKSSQLATQQASKADTLKKLEQLKYEVSRWHGKKDIIFLRKRQSRLKSQGTDGIRSITELGSLMGIDFGIQKIGLYIFKGGSFYSMAIEVGTKLEGKVTGITHFGAFVDLSGGVTGLVHISEIADNYVKDVNDHLKLNDLVTVKVINVDKDGKIGLSIKQALLDRNAVEEIANDSAAEVQVVAKVVVAAAVDLTVVTAEAVLSSPQQANLHLRIKCHAS